MNMLCPQCNEAIPASNINISSDLAKCEKCNSLHKASDIVENEDISKLSIPPTGTKIKINKGLVNSMELTYPKQGMTFGLVPILIFAIFWLTFISVWTWFAAQGSIFFALFSIPFWAVGIGMIVGVINGVSETQTIKLNNDGLVLEKNRVFNSKQYSLSYNEIQLVKMKVYKPTPFSIFDNMGRITKMQQSFVTGLELPSLITGRGTIHFFEDANDSEQEWIVRFISSILKKNK